MSPKSIAPAQTPATIEDEAHYVVLMKKTVQYGRTWLRPGAGLTLKGKVVKELIDDIAEYSPDAG